MVFHISQFFVGKYVGNRPIKLRKSTWKERTDAEALEKQKVCCHLIDNGVKKE
jgi:hypothetical protein